MKRIGLIFPGQGSQFTGMGKDLVEYYPEAAELFALADDTLQFSLSSVMFEGPEETLLETAYSQLAIYVHSLAVFKILSARGAISPTVVAGLSLGEYSALTASGRMSFVEGLKIIQKRAQFMNIACKQQPGAMAAVLGLSAEIVEETLLSLGEEIWLANYNTPTQLVIAGSQEKVQEAATIFTDLGAKRVIFLKVFGAFHTPFMQAAEDALSPYLYDLTLHSSNIPFISTTTSCALSDTNEIRDCLVKQMTSSTRWYQSCFLMEKMVDAFLEVGPGKVLSGLMRSIGVQSPVKSLGTVEGIEKFLSEL